MTELIREYWDWFLFDTLVWTGALLGLALLLRRPVAKHLGAGAAYALWFLPLARLLFPPVTLPAWMRPGFLESAPASAPVVSDLALAPAAESGFSYAEFVAPVAPVTLDSPIDLVTPLVILWLLGAALFMGRRFWLYGELRRELLEDARPVGEVGKIRLVETTAISGPMAFGVIDKVVALPDGFMASRERQVRDLAIAHELEHHRGHDILVNVLIQPLFAVHWFNPLGWMGWTAMRRDQEAACDARVVASRSRDERAAYAAIIADFARRPQIAPRPALAAPMACPVLGDKSIIHRLRSLPMTDDSRRRRFAARGAVAAAVLALPMTASICYVGASPALASAAPEMTEVVHPVGYEDEQPVARRAELAFLDTEAMAEVVQERVEERREQAAEARERAHALREEAHRMRERAHARREDHSAEYSEERKQWVEGRIQFARGRQQWADGRLQWADGRVQHAKNEAKHSEARAVVYASAGEWEEELGEAIEESVALAMNHVPEVIESCRYPDSPVTTIHKDDKAVMYICDTAGDRLALKALKNARRGIETDDRVSEETRREILRDLDAEIRELKRSIRG
ncbi:M56 family metallopeptidase [Qipengyuania sp.]|uniref:M56 family metallopeptidase n=1 Tax=Qipengyuania sp. TaxID=2004515 RepID=UPI003BA8815D